MPSVVSRRSTRKPRSRSCCSMYACRPPACWMLRQRVNGSLSLVMVLRLLPLAPSREVPGTRREAASGGWGLLRRRVQEAARVQLADPGEVGRAGVVHGVEPERLQPQRLAGAAPADLEPLPLQRQLEDRLALVVAAAVGACLHGHQLLRVAALGPLDLLLG